MTLVPAACPECGGPVDRIHQGVIEEPGWSADTRAPGRLVRLATFDACSCCEWCAEPPRQLPAGATR